MREAPNAWTIHAVSQMTGLTVQQIRKWEARYGVVTPRRLPNGYRVYSAHDVERLRQVKSLVDQGVHVKDAVGWLSRPESENTDTPAFYAVRHHLLEAGESLDPIRVTQTLESAGHRWGLTTVVEHIIRPVLHQVGTLWASGQWTEIQEHLTSEACRAYLVQALTRVTVDPTAPATVVAPIPGDRHDLPALMIAVLIKLEGWQPILLGPSPAPGAIERAIHTLKPARAIVTITTPEHLNPFASAIESLQACGRSCRETRIYMGGSGWPPPFIERPPLRQPPDLPALLGEFRSGVPSGL